MNTETAVSGNALYAEFGNSPNSATQLVRPFGEHKYGNRQKLVESEDRGAALQSVRSAQPPMIWARAHTRSNCSSGCACCFGSRGHMETARSWLRKGRVP